MNTSRIKAIITEATELGWGETIGYNGEPFDESWSILLNGQRHTFYDIQVVLLIESAPEWLSSLVSKVEEMQKNNAGLKAALDRITGTFTRERMADIAYDALHEFGGENQ